MNASCDLEAFLGDPLRSQNKAFCMIVNPPSVGVWRQVLIMVLYAIAEKVQYSVSQSNRNVVLVGI